jgi:hypothetical protein
MCVKFLLRLTNEDDKTKETIVACTPLHEAVINQHTKVVLSLTNYSQLQVNELDEKNRSPLFIAYSLG